MRYFSGIKPTGEMHLGNYLGAVRRWVAEQNGLDTIYCMVDLHAMTVEYEVDDFRARSRELSALLLASGLDPEKCMFFTQSHVPEHSELCWMLNCVTTFGELSRQTQFKSKAEKQKSVYVGLFDYPVLMAADILLYSAERVPVGDDQRQHVELARDVAERFNRRFGDVFTLPQATFPKVGARVKDLQDPSAKMSKSEKSPLGTVRMLDTPKQIAKKIKSAVTDSETVIAYDVETKPGVSNLLEIFSCAAGMRIEDAAAHFDGKQYGHLKVETAEAVVEMLRPVQERYAELIREPAEIDRLMAIGAKRAREVAAPMMEQVRRAMGLRG